MTADRRVVATGWPHRLSAYGDNGERVLGQNATLNGLEFHTETLSNILLNGLAPHRLLGGFRGHIDGDFPDCFSNRARSAAEEFL